MCSTSRRLITSPSPVPPKRRVVDTSACPKGLKIRDICSGEIPIPVSVTWIFRRVPESASSTSTASSTLPECVNLTAFPSKLMSICRTRAGSSNSLRGKPGGIRSSRRSPFDAACSRKICRLDSSSSTTSVFSFSMEILPASILE